MYLSNKQPFAYCQIPKVGSSNWLKIIAVLEGIIKSADDIAKEKIHNIPLPTMYNLKEGFHLFKRSTKLLVVRDPFSRLLSCYKDKFLPSRGRSYPLFHKVAVEITKMYKAKEDQMHSKYHLNIPTFNQFVEYITHNKTDLSLLDISIPRHWLPQSQLSSPCDIRYDYILKIESISEEAEYFLRSQNFDTDVHYPASASKVTTSSNNEGSFQEYYSRLRPKQVKSLINYYQEDLSLFDYKIPQLLSSILNSADK